MSLAKVSTVPILVDEAKHSEKLPCGTLLPVRLKIEDGAVTNEGEKV